MTVWPTEYTALCVALKSTVCLSGQDGVNKLDKGRTTRGEDHNGTIELQAVQMNVSVAGALKIHKHEVS